MCGVNLAGLASVTRHIKLSALKPVFQHYRYKTSSLVSGITCNALTRWSLARRGDTSVSLRRGVVWDGAGADGLAPSTSCLLLNGVAVLLVRVVRGEACATPTQYAL